MSNKVEELSRELEELRAKVEELEGALSEAKLAEWPQEGDRYWWIDSQGSVTSDPWDGDCTDEGRAEMGNVFRTEAEADFEVERLKVVAELKKFAMSRRAVRKARGDKSVCFLYLAPDDALFAESDIAYRHPTLYFEDQVEARKAITTVGEGRIKKYYFGIED